MLSVLLVSFELFVPFKCLPLASSAETQQGAHASTSSRRVARCKRLLSEVIRLLVLRGVLAKLL